MRKTILTSMETFPYVKKRSKVVKMETVGDWEEMLVNSC